MDNLAPNFFLNSKSVNNMWVNPMVVFINVFNYLFFEYLKMHI